MKTKAIHFALAVLLTFGLAWAQEDASSQTQQSDAQQQSQSTDTEQEGQAADAEQAQSADMSMDTQTLTELRELHERLGQLIMQLEQQMGAQGAGSDMDTMEQTMQESDMQMQRDALSQASSDLEQVREKIELGEGDETTAEEVERIRAALTAAYSEGETPEAIQNLDTQLGQLTEQLIEGRAEEYQDTYAAAVEGISTAQASMEGATGDQSGDAGAADTQDETSDQQDAGQDGEDSDQDSN